MLSHTCPKTNSSLKFKEFDTGNMELPVQLSHESFYRDGDSRLFVLKLRVKFQEINLPGRQIRKENERTREDPGRCRDLKNQTEEENRFP